MVFESSSTGTKESKFRETRDFIVPNYSIDDCARLAVSFIGSSFSVFIKSNGYMSFVSLTCGTDARLAIEAAAVSNVNSCIVSKRIFEFNTTGITNTNTSSEINNGYSIKVYDYTIKS